MYNFDAFFFYCWMHVAFLHTRDNHLIIMRNIFLSRIFLWSFWSATPLAATLFVRRSLFADKGFLWASSKKKHKKKTCTMEWEVFMAHCYLPFVLELKVTTWQSWSRRLKCQRSTEAHCKDQVMTCIKDRNTHFHTSGRRNGRGGGAVLWVFFAWPLA